jgi:type I restriction enzyme, S subunit
MSLDKITLRDAIISANTGADAIQRAPIVEHDTGVKCLRIGDISNNRDYRDWGFCEVSEIDFGRFRLRSNDIMIARTGASIGVNRLIQHDLNAVFNNGLIRLRCDDERFVSKYLYYLFQTKTYKDHIQSIAHSTSTQPNMQIGDLLRFEFTLLQYSEQRAIAHILGSLDDKIELNRRMNATLEATARALFKSWFVDFDPVHCKARGEHPPGMDAETAALFPDSFEDSKFGPIPRGWRISTIGEEVRVVGGSTPSTAEPIYWEGGTINWATPKDLSDLSMPVLLSTARQITEQGLAQISSRLLAQGTVLLSSRAPVGYLAIAETPVAINQGFIAMICEHTLSNYYVLWWATSHMETIKGKANGTTFQEVSKGSFRPIPILVPSDGVLQGFNVIVEPLYSQIVNNEKESRTLAETRDALLPKLVSGEVRVQSVEESLK